MCPFCYLGKKHFAARELRINSVPFFVLDRKYAVVGAQPREVFTQALTAQ